MNNSTIADYQSDKIGVCKVYDAINCPVTATMGVIGGKWKVILINAISQHEPARFGVLKRKLLGITQTMLTSQLRELEEDGIISRTIYAEIPPRVEYRLTEFGKSLEPILVAMANWGTKYKALQAPQ